MVTHEKIDSLEKYNSTYGDRPLPTTKGDSSWYMGMPEFCETGEYKCELIWHLPNTTFSHYVKKITMDYVEEFGGMPNEDNFWMWREYARIYTGVYKNRDMQSLFDKLSAVNPLHFAHPSLATPGHIAFTSNKLDGLKDKQVSMKVGRYLRRHVPDMTDQEIKEISNKFQAIYGEREVLIADGKKAAELYQMPKHEGWDSCMQYSIDNFSSGDHHPAEVYDSPDIKIAYLLDEDGTHLVARSLINVEENTYVCVYGDERLISLLEKQGYTSGDLHGCRLKKIHLRGSLYVMPYLDGGYQGIEDYNDDYFIVNGNEEGPQANDTGGVIDMNSGYLVCDNCHDSFSEGDETYDHDDNAICPCCIDTYYHRAMIPYGGFAQVHEDDCSYSEYEGEYFHNSMKDDDFVFSEYHQDWLPTDECTYSEDADDWLLTDECIEVEFIEVTGRSYIHQDEFDEETMREAV